MNDPAQKRFLKIGEKLFVGWLMKVEGLGNVDEKKRRELLSMAAQLSFEAAEEFTKVYRGQDD